MNQNTENKPHNERETSAENRSAQTADWLAERKRELREVFENKSKEIGKRTQAEVSERISHYKSAFDKASESFEADNEIQPAEITRELANRINVATEYLQKTEPEQIVEDTAERVRSAPAIALGAAAVCGFVVGRVLASASDAPDAGS